MSAQHTPGPWKFFVHNSDAGDEAYGFYVEGASGHEIVYFDADDKPRTEANARLIAAAPELLTAVETAYSAIAEHAPGLEHLLDVWEPLIAKAKGEAA